jgi:YVTN family beta-propeller protein
MHRYFNGLAAALLLGALCLAITAGAQAPGYHVLARWQVGGEGGWDYLTVDAAARRLYVSHATHVVVLDIDSGQVVGDIPDTPGVHGIAIAPELGKGFVSNGRDNSMTVFDLKTLKALGKVPTGQNPDSILYDPFTKRVFTFNGRSNDATAIDAETSNVAGTIPLGGKPEFSQTDLKGTVFVNLEDKSTVAAIDSKNLKVKTTWSIAPCDGPSGLAFDREHKRLFSVCGNKTMAISDSDAGKLVTTVPIGANPDGATFDAGFAFSSNGDGTMTVVREDSPDKFTVAENAVTQSGARTCAVDPKTHRIFLPSAQYGPAPAPTAEQPRPRAPMLPNSFMVLVVGR